VLAGSAFDALVVEPHWLEITKHEVPVSGLPRELDGFTIAQLSDAHLRRIGPVEEAIARELRACDVHLLVLTGDIVDSRESLSVLREFADGLRRPGMSAVANLGNWEHWGQIAGPDLTAAYADSGATLLVNEHLRLRGGIHVFATDDATGGVPRLEMLNTAKGDARLLLTHSPELLDRVDATFNRFSLALAGHTHGGQLRLTSAVVPFMPGGSGRFVAGWYDVPVGRAYVSRGTGTSIAPARFTCRPELPIFTLRQG
jgi:predicted MPP superfamily phosphohydrolase